jgi:hypothetical protein
MEIAGVASIHGSLKTTRRAEASGIRTKIVTVQVVEEGQTEKPQRIFALDLDLC